MIQVARDLGIADSTLHHWCKEFGEHGVQAFPGSGHQTPQEEEMRQLKRGNELLRQERDILKKRSCRCVTPMRMKILPKWPVVYFCEGTAEKPPKAVEQQAR